MDIEHYKHSPLPWQEPDGKRIFCRDYSIAKTYGPNAEADARLIITSVNHAAQLAEALKCAEMVLAERGVELKEITRALTNLKAAQ